MPDPRSRHLEARMLIVAEMLEQAASEVRRLVGRIKDDDKSHDDADEAGSPNAS